MYTFNSISYLVLLPHFFNLTNIYLFRVPTIFLSFLRDFDSYLEKEKKLLQVRINRERVVISSESRYATVRDM